MHIKKYTADKIINSIYSNSAANCRSSKPSLSIKIKSILCMCARKRERERSRGRGDWQSRFRIHCARSLNSRRIVLAPRCSPTGPGSVCEISISLHGEVSLLAPRAPTLIESQSVSQSVRRSDAVRAHRYTSPLAPFASERGKFARLSHSFFHPFFTRFLSLLLALSLSVLPIEGVDNRALKSPRDHRYLRRAIVSRARAP